MNANGQVKKVCVRWVCILVALIPIIALIWFLLAT
jgi:hypothetical protein